MNSLHKTYMVQILQNEVFSFIKYFHVTDHTEQKYKI